MKLARVSGALSLMALAAMASPFASADDAGWYVGGNVGQSKAKIDDARIASGLLGGGYGTTSIVDDDRARGYKLFGGYQFNKNFALEAGYFDLGKFGFTATTLPPGTLNGNIRLKGLNLDLVGIAPISEKFSAFGRVGVNYAQARDSFVGTGSVHVPNPNPSKNGANIKFGLGLQYDFTEALAMRVEGERYRVNDAVGNKGDINLVSVGLVYRFGKEAPAPVSHFVAPPREPVAEVAVVEPMKPVPPPAPRFEKTTLSATELFAFNSAVLQMPQPKLDEVATALNNNKEINHVVITGYTDRIGSDKYNQKLSERRADSVKHHLVSKGIDANRLQTEGKGEANPVVVCNDKKRAALIKCLEPNRRVEVEEITIERRVK